MYMLTEYQITKLLEYQGRADVYNTMLHGLVSFVVKIVGDEDIAHNFIYGLWDLDRVLAELQPGVEE